MKNKKFIITCLAAVLLAGTGISCNDDFLDAKPDNKLNIESVFSNRAQTEKWWGGLFSLIEDPWGKYPYGSDAYGLMSDEMDANWVNPAVNTGTISADGGFWLNSLTYYEKMRNCAIFIANVEKNEELRNAANGPQLITQYKAEARFLRAYYYWIMCKNLGPMPFQPDEPQSPYYDYAKPRPTWDAAVEYIMKEMDAAKADLPIDYYQGETTTIDGTQVGRINKLIVEAVQSQVLLFSASPLFNGNTEFADWKNPDGTNILPQTYDANKWTKAATAAKKVIDMAEAQGKGLYTTADTNPFVRAYNSVRNLYWDGYNKEGIWLRPSSNTFNYSIHAAPRSTQGTAYNGIAVVQSLVDEFQMADGKSITSSSTYNEKTYSTAATPYYVAGTNNMYANREARFYAWITFNGAVNPGASKAGDTYVQFFNSGTSGKKGSPRDWPKTGYTVRKNIHPTFSVNPQVNPSRPAMLIRLAEIYLNYAEALNESQPGHPDIALYLNKVRNRAGLPDVPAGLSQAEMRQALIHERRIELAFEGHRFFDVRRWKIADKPGSNQGGDFYGMNMDAGTTLSSPEFHTRTKVFTRAPFNRRYYFAPVYQAEMDRNKQLVQVPGY